MRERPSLNRLAQETSPYLRTEGVNHGDWLPSHMPLLEGCGLVTGRSAAYVCRRFVCAAPVTDPERLADQLRGIPGTGLD